MSPKPKTLGFCPKTIENLKFLGFRWFWDKNLKILGFGLILGWVAENNKKGGKPRNDMLSIILTIMENTRTKHGTNPRTLNAMNGLSNPGKNSASVDWGQLVSTGNLPNARHNAHYFRTWIPNLKYT